MERRVKERNHGAGRKRLDLRMGQRVMGGKNIFPSLGWKGRGRGFRGRAGLLKGLILAVVLSACVVGRASAQIPGLDIIGEIAKRVVMAIDLKVQQAQEATMELQVAQRELENVLVGNELSDIAGWLGDQRDLFTEFYGELWQVKSVISGFVRVGSMIDEEATMVGQVRQMVAALGADKHFTPAEVEMMGNVLAGMVRESVANLDRLSMVVTALTTQMGDGDRLGVVDEAGSAIDRSFGDTQEFYQHCVGLSMARARDAADVVATRALWGLR